MDLSYYGLEDLIAQATQGVNLHKKSEISEKQLIHISKMSISATGRIKKSFLWIKKKVLHLNFKKLFFLHCFDAINS